MIKEEKVQLYLTFLSALTTVMLAHLKQRSSLYLPRKRVGYQEWLSLTVPPSILDLNLFLDELQNWIRKVNSTMDPTSPITNLGTS